MPLKLGCKHTLSRISDLVAESYGISSFAIDARPSLSIYIPTSFDMKLCTLEAVVQSRNPERSSGSAKLVPNVYATPQHLFIGRSFRKHPIFNKYLLQLSTFFFFF